MAAPAQPALPEEQLEVLTALARSPAGQYFSPSLADAYLRSLESYATNNGFVQPAPNTGHRIYAVANGANGARVASAAEAQADIVGHPGGALKGFTTPAQARAFLDVITYLRTMPTISNAEATLRAARMAYTNSLARLTVAGNKVLPMHPVTALPYSVKVTPMEVPAFVHTPHRTAIVLANHLVEINFHSLEPLSDPSAVYPFESNSRGSAQPVTAERDSVVYSTSNGVEVFAETKDGALSRVVPHSTVMLDDGTAFPAYNPLVPVAPLPDQGLTTDTLFWVVLQGRQVGIFHATSDEIRAMLPDDASVAKGFMTLEEASAFWHYELREHWPLAEVTEAPHIEEQAVEALQNVEGHAPQLVGELITALAH
ncbi:unnamed protein product [Peniophora sp. CBMAI 1063]|nr:unnamed protein product [Peniophora sp. CBMAI 1063]